MTLLIELGGGAVEPALDRLPERLRVGRCRADGEQNTEWNG